MKNINWLLLLTFVTSTSFASEVNFSGYLRGGTGTNLRGGKQQCLNNSGLPGNFLRLGNECSFYSEIDMVFHHKKADEKDPVYFRTHTRLMFGAQGKKQWEQASDREVHNIEAFVMAGGFSELPGEYWIGKRYYRDVDQYINDWYYYADMSGVGAGIDNLKLGSGKFAVAHLIQADDTETSSGFPILQALDLRWKDVPVFAGQNINFWAVYAFAEGSTTASTAKTYEATNGYSVATRLNGPLFSGNNNFSLLYGQGAMKDFNIYGSAKVLSTDTSQNRAWNIRVVEDWSRDVSDRWAMMVALTGEHGDKGTSQNSRRQFESIGIRPIYFISDRAQLVFEAGYSHIKEDSEFAQGKPVGDRELARVTLAPQISFSKSIWGRPVMRAFVSHTMWSNTNKSFIASSAPTFGNETSGTNFGYQFEVWF